MAIATKVADTFIFRNFKSRMAEEILGFVQKDKAEFTWRK